MSDPLLALGAYFGFMVLALSVLALPLSPATLLAVKVAPPWLVALVATAAAAVASVFDYWFVRRAFRIRVLDQVRQRGLFQRAEGWARRAPFLTTLAFAGLPVPFTVARVLVPLIGYPRARFIIAVCLGRFARILVIALFGQAVEIPTEVLVGLLVAGLVLAALVYTVRRLRWLGRQRRLRLRPPLVEAHPRGEGGVAQQPGVVPEGRGDD